jgi:uncharacterized coiled-coil DUF342 family protein
MTQTNLDEIASEVKKVNQRLDNIEKTLTTLMTMITPEEELTPEEWRELDTIEEEMKQGQYITLEELEKTLR